MPTYDFSKPIPPDQWLTAERLRKLRRDAVDARTEPGEEESQLAVCALVDELVHRRKTLVPSIDPDLRAKGLCGKQWRSAGAEYACRLPADHPAATCRNAPEGEVATALADLRSSNWASDNITPEYLRTLRKVIGELRDQLGSVITDRNHWVEEARRWRNRAEQACATTLQWNNERTGRGQGGSGGDAGSMVSYQTNPTKMTGVVSSWEHKPEDGPMTLEATIADMTMNVSLRKLMDAPDHGIKSALYWLDHLANLQRAAITDRASDGLGKPLSAKRVGDIGDVGELVKQAEALDRTIEQHTLDIEDVKRRLVKFETAPASPNTDRGPGSPQRTAPAALSPIKWLDRAQAGDALEARVDGSWHEAVIHELVANERGKVTAIKVRITEADYTPARAIVLFLMVTDPATTNFSVHDNLRPSRDSRPASWSDAHHAWLMSLKVGDDVEIEIGLKKNWTRGTVSKLISDVRDIPRPQTRECVHCGNAHRFTTDADDTSNCPKCGGELSPISRLDKPMETDRTGSLYGFAITVTGDALPRGGFEGGMPVVNYEKLFIVSLTDARTMLRRPQVGSGG
jgi:hypothetical protein